MNICMLVWSYWPVPVGGAEGQCRKLSRVLAASDVHCTVLTARLRKDNSARERDGAVDIVRIAVSQIWIDRVIAWRDRIFSKSKKPAKSHAAACSVSQSTSAKRTLLSGTVRWMNTMSFILGATAWLLRNKRNIDVIHVHIGDWIAGYAGWIGSCLNIPVVCKASDMPAFPELGNSIPFHMAWDAWRRKIHYVAMHEDIHNELVDGGVKQEKIRPIPNGVEVPADKAEPSQGEYVLFTGNLTQGASHKAFDVLFKAWAEVCSRLPDARLVIAGQGDADPWKRLVEHLGCARNVHFTGYVHSMENLYRDASLFVLPSRHEGMSNALLEAQAWGLPAVVSDIPGNRAVVENGITGKIVPVGDHVELAKAILALLRDPLERAAMGMQARTRIETQFSMNRIAGKYRSLYVELLQNE